MRRSDREIKEFSDIISVIEKCDVCRLAFNDEEYPYILPLNFGMKVEDNKVVFYFHGALEGTKYELMNKNNKVGFEMDCSHRLVTDLEACNCTMEYESVIGYGLIRDVPDHEKLEALNLIMLHYPVDRNFKINADILPVTRVFKLAVSKMTGKRRMVKS